MEIRLARPDDRDEIVSMYERSQEATGLPYPQHVPKMELGKRLYARAAIHRYVAVDKQKIVGHGLIEYANQSHITEWQAALDYPTAPLLEMGGAFVEPTLGRLGIWTALLSHRIDVIRDTGATPVSVTWAQNEHVKKKFITFGGIITCRKPTAHGDVDLFIFP